MVSSEITLRIVDEAEGRELNKAYRQKDYATNVLSFPAAISAEGHLGDLALAFGTCAREAAEQDKALCDHVQHLTVHGVLHLMGYDHDDDAEADTGADGTDDAERHP